MSEFLFQLSWDYNITHTILLNEGFFVVIYNFLSIRPEYKKKISVRKNNSRLNAMMNSDVFSMVLNSMLYRVSIKFLCTLKNL